MMTRKFFLSIAVTLWLYTPSKAQTSYFPPLAGTNWDTLSPASLGWCTNYLDTLNNLLSATNTKGFVILKDGKIVFEKYYGTFTVDSLWYWASAGKSLTAFSVGIAQEQGFLSINDTTSKYLGAGWTSCPANKEDLITIRNQLTMTTGLDDNVPDNDCTSDTCLVYNADAGTRWAYHNAPYTLLQDVMDNATGNFNTFFISNLRNRIGMDGFWLPNGYNSVYYSKARSMARYGLLILNKGIWNTDTLLHDTAYFNNMVNTSQALNLSYGYLWWLNGKGSFMIPGSQFQFTGNIIPNAPNDMICALGKNDQKIHLVPSQNLVLVRMGNPAYNNQLVPLVLDNEIWGVLNHVFCSSTNVQLSNERMSDLKIYPNPVNDILNIELPLDNGELFNLQFFDATGRKLMVRKITDNTNINVSNLSAGCYYLKATQENFSGFYKVVVKK